MVRLFIRHSVADYEAWKRRYDEFDEDRAGMGVLGHRVFRSSDDGNDVTVWHDFESPESANDFITSPRLREAMGEAGVIGTPTTWLTTPA